MDTNNKFITEFCTFCFSTGSTLEGISNSFVTINWLYSLHKALASENFFYRSNHVFIEDNASPHTSAVTVAFKNMLQLKICQTAGASFIALPVEGCFCALKRKVNYFSRTKNEKHEQLLNDQHPTFNERFGGEICLKITEMTPESLKKIERGRFALLAKFLHLIAV